MANTAATNIGRVTQVTGAVVDVRFDPALKRLDIDLDFPPGSRFPHPETGRPCAVYDTEPRDWRHLNFFQFECYLHAHVPRVDGGPDGGGVKRVAVPWARPFGQFTLLMESMVLLLARGGMTVAEVARTLGEYPQRIWGIVLHHVARAHARLDLGSVRVVSVDEVCRADRCYQTNLKYEVADWVPRPLRQARRGRNFARVAGPWMDVGNHCTGRGTCLPQVGQHQFARGAQRVGVRALVGVAGVHARPDHQHRVRCP